MTNPPPATASFGIRHGPCLGVARPCGAVQASFNELETASGEGQAEDQFGVSI